MSRRSIKNYKFFYSTGEFKGARNFKMPKTTRGLVIEFAILVFLNLLDLGTDIAVYSEAQISRDRYKGLIKSPDYKSNFTKGFQFCTNSEWNKRDYQDKIDSFGRVVDVYLFFLFASAVILVCYMVVFVWFILKCKREEYYLIENPEKLADIKFTFGALLSFALDVPGASIAVYLYSERWGATGFLCWECAQDGQCNDKRVFAKRTYVIIAALAFNFLSLSIISLWKGVTTFYRWSKTDKVDCWPVRGCVSMFVGCIYTVIMLTPSLGVFKYKFFVMPSQRNNVFAEFTDSLFMIGLLGWIILMVVGCCFPLLRMIRLGPSNNPDRKGYGGIPL